MKYAELTDEGVTVKVTLYVRVWIEIFFWQKTTAAQGVTLYVRVWIEIFTTCTIVGNAASHPLREGVD